MDEYVTRRVEWCQTCDMCQYTKTGTGGSKNPLKHACITYNPMERLGIDLIVFRTPTVRRNTVMLAVQDYASK